MTEISSLKVALTKARHIFRGKRLSRMAVILVLPLVLCVGCTVPLPVITYSYVEASSYEIHPADDAAKTQFVNRVSEWLTSNGYTEITDPGKIREITHSSGDINPQMRVFQKPLDEEMPESFFAVRISDISIADEPHLMVTHSADRSGQQKDHDRQIPQIEPEFKRFKEAFPELKPDL